MINHLKINHSYNFNCKLLKHSFNQIATNKILDTKSTNKIYCLNLAAYNLAKSTNKTAISYNHFKGSKKAFNYKSYKSIKLVRFWLVAMLKGFKKGINKKIRLKIYGWGLVGIILLISTNKIFEMMMHFNKIILKMILISSYGWSDILTKRYGRKSLN